MSELLIKSLERDQNVDLAIKNSFESFINENEKTAKSLVMYLDDQFKKEFKNNTEVEISEKIDKIIQIFKFLKNKDSDLVVSRAVIKIVWYFFNYLDHSYKQLIMDQDT